MWSNDPPEPTYLDVLAQVFADVEAQVITFPNPLQGRDATATIYSGIGRLALTLQRDRTRPHHLRRPRTVRVRATASSKSRSRAGERNEHREAKHGRPNDGKPAVPRIVSLRHWWMTRNPSSAPGTVAAM